MTDKPTAFDVQAKYPNEQIQRSCEERLKQLRTAQSRDQVRLEFHQGQGYLQALVDAGLITRQEGGVISCQLIETMVQASSRLSDEGAQ
ncbi:hypothetical protein HBO12_27700 [Pseudomonas sp. WS 5059]|uniref:Uncharacterized protein n=2 Tax=Pseudomonas TaxID=286 RepID=A0A7Y1MUB8_9PSED|nr:MULTISPECIES: hypothetical protein [Pseudomonas]MBJ2264185.1 hypothetical protein [Pseudomonas sp. MF6787]MBN0979873.1 hypothetical protein [Pseudomonas hygromyciniae]MCF5506516.1 hypothetical protein [Pseudomonas sp. PA-3-6H]MCF5517343.1 hypothetical protein [Pseudomonas sp. PA-3-6E]MCF5561767.1 hypothetical protein [Pseudomonas sp. PA-3-5D]